MTDYTRSTGSSGTMLLRDTGSTVEFWLKAGSSTFDHEMPWRYYVNGAWSTYRNFDFVSGGAYQKLGAVSVTTDQTVGFEIGDTGTAGLGGPTQLTASIPRATVPPAPSTFAVSSVSSTSVTGDLDGRGDGGSPVLEWQVAYGTNGSTPQYFKDTDNAGGATITGLTPGTVYYFWTRARNAKGWSAYSARVQATTWRVPDAPTQVAVSNITQTSVDTKFSGRGNGGTTTLEYQLGYGTSSSGPTTWVTDNSGNMTVTGLIPGTKYYFWSRARNSVGWSPLSTVSSATTLAGARVNVNGVWKSAVPYVNVNGVWKAAKPWGRIAGVWKETG